MIYLLFLENTFISIYTYNNIKHLKFYLIVLVHL